MANRNLKRDRGALEKAIADLYAVINIGAAGAATLVAASSQGISSVTHVGAGVYDIFLSDIWTRVLELEVTLKVAGGASTVFQQVLKLDSSAAAIPKVRVQLNDATGAPVDPANGEILLVHLGLKNSSIGG